MLKNLILLSFEITNVCNLSKAHLRCPINDEGRYNSSEIKTPLVNDDIINFANYCISQGFEGLIHWHYYNEPLIVKNQILEIIDKIPNGKFGLLTNGTLLERDFEKLTYLNKFDEVIITNYTPHSDNAFWEQLVKMYPHTTVQTAYLDERRRENVPTFFNPNKTACRRGDFELIVDYYGNGHMCCSDYRNEIKFGNIKTDSYDTFIDNWGNEKSKIASWNAETYNNLPQICKSCLIRTPHLSEQKVFSFKQKK